MGVENNKKTLCQICANLIGTSWYFVTQHATSVTVSLIKIMVNKWNHCLLISRSSVRSRDGPPFKSMGMCHNSRPCMKSNKCGKMCDASVRASKGWGKPNDTNNPETAETAEVVVCQWNTANKWQPRCECGSEGGDGRTGQCVPWR